MEAKRALVLGASGLIGSFVVQKLLAQPLVEKVVVVVRKPLTFQHPKLEQVLADYSTFEKATSELRVDELYCCLGTTQKKTPNKVRYYEVDHDYPFLAAKLFKEKGTKTYILVSSIGASAKSSSFYLQTKGQLEEDVMALNFNKTLIFRPSLLLGKRNEQRILEGASSVLMRMINPFLFGKLKKYRSISAEEVAHAMVTLPDLQREKVKHYTWEEIKQIG